MTAPSSPGVETVPSASTIRRVRAVARDAPALLEAVLAGELGVATAARLVRELGAEGAVRHLEERRARRSRWLGELSRQLELPFGEAYR